MLFLTSFPKMAASLTPFGDICASFASNSRITAPGVSAHERSDNMFDKSPVFALGFRPFYLLAGLFALLAIPLWVLTFPGDSLTGNYLHGLAWHSHEMIFGFAVAVIAGFLLTAVRNWTGRPTPVGAALALIAALWLFARVLMMSGPAALAATADILFLPLLGVVVAIPIIGSRNSRNYKLLVVIAGLTLANTGYHLAMMGAVPPWLASASLVLALDIFVILIAIIGGRVTPAFIGNAVADAKPRHIAAVEVTSFATLIIILVLGVSSRWVAIPQIGWVTVFAVAALAQGIRLWLWQPLRARGNWLLMMLPVAYAWLPVTLALRAIAVTGAVPVSAAHHTLTVGAIASLMMAMMTRSSLGHSGRPLVAGRAEIGAFVLLQLSAIVRVLGASMFSSLYQESLYVSGALWTVAFAIFLWRYAPILLRPRIDGRPG